jgi:CubicO group peptidase (beta-lactamase class C family)
LQHTSGIKFSDQEFNIISDNAEFYWGHDLRKEMTALTIKTAPNMEFHYSSANTQLLALIIERITNKSVSNYLETKIWQPLGMGTAYWSLDRKDEKGMEKAFVVFRQGQLISLNLEDCISTKGTGKEIRLFQEHG